MDLDENDKKMLVIIIILLFTIAGLFTYHYFSTKKQNEAYEKQKDMEAKELLKKTKKEYAKKDDVISYVKDYMLNNNLADESSIHIWEATSVKLYKDSNDNYYYTVDGYYKCNQGSKCVDGLVTQPDVNGNYDWGMIAKYDLNTESLVEVYSKDKISLEELEEVNIEVE